MKIEYTTTVNIECKPMVDKMVKMLASFSQEEKRELLFFMSGVQFGRICTSQILLAEERPDSA